MVELDGAGAPVYNNQYSFTFNGIDEKFDGVNDSAFDLIDEFTLSAWIKPESKDPPDDGAIIDKSTGNIGGLGTGWSLYHDDNNPGGVAVDFKSGSIASGRETLRSTSITAGTWHHVAATWRNGTGSLYVDSILEDDVEASFDEITANTQNVIIGATSPSPTAANDYTGSIQNVSIWNSEFNQADINELFNGGTPTDLNNHSKISSGVAWYQLGGNGDDDTFNSGVVPNRWECDNSFNPGTYILRGLPMPFSTRVTDTP